MSGIGMQEEGRGHSGRLSPESVESIVRRVPFFF